MGYRLIYLNKKTLVCYEQEIITSARIDHKSAGTDIKLNKKHPYNLASIPWLQFNAITEIHKLFSFDKCISIQVMGAIFTSDIIKHE